MVAVRGGAGASGDPPRVDQPLGLLHVATSSFAADQFRARGRKCSLPQQAVSSLPLGLQALAASAGSEVERASSRMPAACMGGKRSRHKRSSGSWGVEKQQGFCHLLEQHPWPPRLSALAFFVLYSVYLKNHDMADIHNVPSLKKISI